MRLPTIEEAACGVATTLLALLAGPVVVSLFLALAAGLPAFLLVGGAYMLTRWIASLLRASVRLALPRPLPRTHPGRPLGASGAGSGGAKASTASRR